MTKIKSFTKDNFSTKLNHKQSFAIASYLLSANLISDYNIRDLGELFDEEAKELRIIKAFGMAGKLWNNNDRIYVSGWGHSEIPSEQYQKQQGRIDEINKNIAEFIELYKD